MSKDLTSRSEQASLESIIDEVLSRIRENETPTLKEYQGRYPIYAETLREVWDAILAIEFAKLSARGSGSIANIGYDETNTEGSFSLTPIPANLNGLDGEERQDQWPDHQPTTEFEVSIGRYQILRRLGQGGFGTVLLGQDTQLDRLVAIKLPLKRRMRNEETKHLYIQEAKTLALLDHPAIVPIYDCGVIPDGRCFVVSKYIDGRDLSKVMQDGRMGFTAIAELIIAIADALQYVHRSKIVHRDIKPGNILVGEDGRYYLADFGLALRDVSIADPDTPLVGTFRYMSPELVRREGHRIDGRSDQFSLGVVMYELLTQRSPFSGDSARSVLRSILEDTPVSPDQLGLGVPSELSRICMKLLSKLAIHRYAEPRDLSSDLREWLKSQLNTSGLSSGVGDPSTRWLPDSESSEASKDVVVAPRGLRPFARSDAYFFHRLLPGARDRDGIPISITQWRRWISHSDEPLELRRVGVISGPTGCGKSSFVRAGLVPTLGRDVTTVLVDASPDLTEKYLHSAVDRVSSLRDSHSMDSDSRSLGSDPLSERLAQIRLNRGLMGRKKLVIVIDQFEQWLHVHPDPLHSELVAAIRQCDGEFLQCILLVRDDFWLGLSQFMEAVESPLQMGQNAMMLDVFDQGHARDVLSEFGRGYGVLPKKSLPLSKDQERFLDHAIGNLAVNGKVVPVQLAIFAEMVKGREWSPATLKKLGGTAGIGAQFLAESFSERYAPANQRAHAISARNVLTSLLPPSGTDIKAGRKTRSEIRRLSGYSEDSVSFESLMAILENELKLISPISTYDQSRSDLSSDSDEDVSSYQLSHDFLVPSVREWVNSLQRQTWKGRLKQRQEELANLWSSHSESRFIPGVFEGLAMRLLLREVDRSPAEASMLRVRDRKTAVIASLLAIVFFSITWLGVRYQQRTRVQSLVQQLITADPEQANKIISELREHGSDARRELEKTQGAVAEGRPAFLVRIAKAHWDSTLHPDIYEELRNTTDDELVPLAIDALTPYRANVVERCWAELERPQDEKTSVGSDEERDRRRLRMVQTLAQMDPPLGAESRERWSKVIEPSTQSLIRECIRHPDQFGRYSVSLKPIHLLLRESLMQSVGQEAEDSYHRFAISFLVSSSSHDDSFLTDVGLNSSNWQRAILLPPVERLDESVLQKGLTGDLGVMQSIRSSGVSESTHAAIRRATAACLLLKYYEANRVKGDTESIWGLLTRSEDNSCRTKLIEQMVYFGVSERMLFERLSTTPDAGVLSGILQVFGEMAENKVRLSGTTQAAIRLLYKEHPDAGVHASARWCLQNVGDSESDLQLAVDSPENSRDGTTGLRQWVVTPNGQVMSKVAIRRPDGAEYILLAASTEVTVEQYQVFNAGKYVAKEYAPYTNCPVNVVRWPDALAYCNWLSRQEGLPEFYPTDPEDYAAWTADPESIRLSTGYRLPMAYEWEAFSKAGAVTRFHFGEFGSSMLRYEWFGKNHDNYLRRIGQPIDDSTDEGKSVKIPSKPVGQLRPNELGIFDSVSNVCEWCNDRGGSSSGEREVRGTAATAMFSQYIHMEGSHNPLVEYNSIGMRVVRSLPPSR